MNMLRRYIYPKLRKIMGFLCICSLIAEACSIYYSAFSSYIVGVLLSTLFGVLTIALFYGYVRVSMAGMEASETP